MKQLISWFKSKEDAVRAKNSLVESGFEINQDAGENGIISSNVFRFTKGEIHRWIYGGVGGFILGILFGMLLIENLIIIPRLAPLFSVDSSALVFFSGLVGAALVGSITSIISISTKNISKQKKKEKDKESKTGESMNTLRDQEKITEKEFGLILSNANAHQLRDIRQILQNNNANRIEEVSMV
ncbi:MAG: hypothetical protein AB7U98_09370 [Candidatus Nitrosocosmicus sp.]